MCVSLSLGLSTRVVCTLLTRSHLQALGGERALGRSCRARFVRRRQHGSARQARLGHQGRRRRQKRRERQPTALGPRDRRRRIREARLLERPHRLLRALLVRARGRQGRQARPQGAFRRRCWQCVLSFALLARDDPADARTSHAGPDWMLGQATHGPLSTSTWISAASGGALRVTSLADGTSYTVSTPYVSISTARVVSPTQVVVLGSPATKPSLLSLLTLPSSASSSTDGVQEEVLKLSSSASVDPAFVSEGTKISYPTPDGATAYAIFYPPSSGSHAGPEGTAPPLVTHCHGGPTSAARRGLDWTIAFFTSRGFAYVDVDYGGSSGASRSLSRARSRIERPALTLLLFLAQGTARSSASASPGSGASSTSTTRSLALSTSSRRARSTRRRSRSRAARQVRLALLLSSPARSLLASR